MNAFEAYSRARANLCPIVAVYDGPGTESAPNIENRDNEGIYVRLLNGRPDGACIVKERSDGKL